jgi:MFS family permease
LTSTFSRIGAITASATLLQGANGLLQALLPLRMSVTGLSVGAVGAVATAYGLGFAGGCVLAPVLIRKIGHTRAFALCAGILGAVALLFTRAASLEGWITLRGVSGAALAVLFTVADGWISARATAGNRGRVLSIYMVCTKVALVVSPLCIALGEITGSGLFIAVAALLCFSLVPLIASAGEPRPPTGIRPNIRFLFHGAPSAAAGAFAVGLMNGPVLALAPIYGLGLGFSPEVAAGLLFALQGGSLVFQWPLGWLSDQIDRRLVIAGLAAGTAAVSGLLIWGTGLNSAAALIAGFALWGALALCIYAVCVAHATDLVETSAIVPTISTLLICWAAGTTIGPVVAALVMERIGLHGLFLYAGGVAVSLAAFVVVRIVLRSRAPIPGGFVDIAPLSPASGSLTEQVKRNGPSPD